MGTEESGVLCYGGKCVSVSAWAFMPTPVQSRAILQPGSSPVGCRSRLQVSTNAPKSLYPHGDSQIQLASTLCGQRWGNDHGSLSLRVPIWGRECRCCEDT